MVMGRAKKKIPGNVNITSHCSVIGFLASPNLTQHTFRFCLTNTASVPEQIEKIKRTTKVQILRRFSVFVMAFFSYCNGSNKIILCSSLQKKKKKIIF